MFVTRRTFDKFMAALLYATARYPKMR